MTAYQDIIINKIKDVLLYISAFVPMQALILIKLIIELLCGNIPLNVLSIIYLVTLILLITIGGLGLLLNTTLSNDQSGVVIILQDTFAAVLDIPTIAVFILSAVLGNILLMFISFILALMSFSFVEISGLFVLKEIMITVFSGLVIPTWFFPGELAIIVNFLPFQYMIQVPLGFLCGRIDASEMGINLLIQIFWITAAVVLTFFIWRKNTADLESFGG